MEAKTLWQKNKWILYLGIIVGCLAILLDQCNNSEPTVLKLDVNTKEVKGKFEFKKPNHIVLSADVKDDGMEELLKQNEALMAENAILLEKFKKQPDSIKTVLYERAIELKKFSNTFEDEFVKIDVTGIAQGEVKNLKSDYTIKPQVVKVDVVVPQKKTFEIRTGVEYGNTLELDKSVFKGNLEYQNKKGTSFSYGYDTDKRHWVGIKIKLF